MIMNAVVKDGLGIIILDIVVMWSYCNLYNMFPAKILYIQIANEGITLLYTEFEYSHIHS